METGTLCESHVAGAAKEAVLAVAKAAAASQRQQHRAAGLLPQLELRPVAAATMQ